MRFPLGLLGGRRYGVAGHTMLTIHAVHTICAVDDAVLTAGSSFLQDYVDIGTAEAKAVD